jgi:hypothetical protein
MNFGSETITVVTATGKFHKGQQSSLIKQYEVREKVDYSDLPKIMSAFVEELAGIEGLKKASFEFEYPQTKRDNQFFLVKSYSVIA